MPDDRNRPRSLVDHRDHRVDVVSQTDATPIRIFRLEAGQRERTNLMASPLERRCDLVPRRGVEPETGDQDDVHARMLPATTDSHCRALGERSPRAIIQP